MITRSKQNWTVGEMVKVGFLTLRITAARPTPGDGLPDVYELENPSNGRKYEFTPHHGITRRREYDSIH
jgi:hypothetical protein